VVVHLKQLVQNLFQRRPAQRTEEAASEGASKARVPTASDQVSAGNTGLDGSTKTLDNFDFRITVKSGDGEQGVFDLRHVAPGDTPWSNATNTGGFEDEDGSNPQLSQNSVNLGFNFMKAIFGTDALDAGETYDITLQAFDHGKIVAQVHDYLVVA